MPETLKSNAINLSRDESTQDSSEPTPILDLFVLVFSPSVCWIIIKQNHRS